MEFYQLRSFAAVAELGHLTRAAERVHVSQPALSAQIKALEEELGVRLFERNPGGMALTRAGERLLEQTEKVLAAAEELKNAAKALRGEIAGRLRIGTVLSPELIRLGEFFGRAMERFPLLELEFHNQVSGEAIEAVRDGSLDGSFYFGDIPHQSVTGLALREMAYRVTAPAAWAERVRQADWEGIAALPWVLTPPISSHNHLVQQMFRSHGVAAPAKLVEADQEPVVASLVVSGAGVSLMREDVALERERAGEVCIWDKVRLTTTLWFVYLADRTQDPLIQALLEVLQKTWASPDPSARA
ncbi:MAG: LysR family transcriptional regulator [Betaproteobacteria bacterium]|nr:LysR family transcriptional regulator [Betaproteobacteria bacterium]MBI2959647.1 LysR family transcriptional regulator [Betaproteobacteria bacterium]